MTDPLDKLIGQTLVFGIPGPRPTAADIKLFKDTHAAGLILYRINYRSPVQIKALITGMEESLGRRLLVTADHEGGRVIMFGGGVTVFPDNRAFGAADRTAWTAAQGRMEGRELRRLGVDVNFSPTVDVLTPGFSPNIGIRAYGRDPHRVAALAVARIRALQQQGVTACAKHFPGLGPAAVDPHLDLPVIGLTWRDLRRKHLIPFRAALKAGVGMVMSSHPLYPRLDPTPRTPATFSRRIITDLLRNELGFEGVIASDDLEMGALRNLATVDRAAVLAAKAGHDLILCCHRADLQRRVFRGLREAYRSGELRVADLEDSVRRIGALPWRRPRFAPGAPAPEPGGAALAARVAETSLRVRRTAASPPLPLQGAPLVFFPRFAPLAQRILIEKELLHPQAYFGGRAADLRLLNIDPGVEEVRRAAAVARRAKERPVVLFCFDAHLQPGLRRLIQKLQAGGRPLVLVLLRDPYDEEYAGPRTTVLTAFGFRRCQIDACLNALFGR